MGSHEPASQGDKEADQVLRVAVVGSGLSGLVAAHLLSLDLVPLADDGVSGESGETSQATQQRPRSVEVHLFERAQRLGMDSESITIGQSKDNEGLRVDVPMRSFNTGYYPETLALYKRLGIPVRSTNFTYAFSLLPSQPRSRSSSSLSKSRVPHPSLLYNGYSGLKGFGLPSHLGLTLPTWTSLHAFASSPIASTQRLASNLLVTWSYLRLVLLYLFSYLHLLLLALYHHHLGHTTDPRHALSTQPLSTFCATHNLSPSFVDALLVPLFSAVMTAQAESVRQAPAAEVLAYVARTAFRDHCSVACGVRQVEQTLVGRVPASQIHTGATVEGVRPSKSKRGTACLDVRIGGHRREYDGFHHVIFATQANQSSGFLAEYAHAVRMSRRSAGAGSNRSPEEDREWAGAVRGEAERLENMAGRLGSFRYEESVVVNHTDRSVLPDREDWRDLNLISPVATAQHVSKARMQALGSLEHDTHTMATHILRHGGGGGGGGGSDDDDGSSALVLQSTNPLRRLTPDPSTVLSTSRFERVILTPRSKLERSALFHWRRARRAPRDSEERWWSPNAREVWRASRADRRYEGTWAAAKNFLRTYLGTPVSERWMLELGALQGGSDVRFAGVWSCGSWGAGVPLLEGCVGSARLVVGELLEREGWTWEKAPW